MTPYRTPKQREYDRRKGLAESTIAFLASRKGANTTVTTATFRTMLLLSDGYTTWRGKRYEIVGKSLGAGVYRVSLEEA